jgi:hypothetical protein
VQVMKMTSRESKRKEGKSAREKTLRGSKVGCDDGRQRSRHPVLRSFFAACSQRVVQPDCAASQRMLENFFDWYRHLHAQVFRNFPMVSEVDRWVRSEHYETKPRSPLFLVTSIFPLIRPEY